MPTMETPKGQWRKVNDNLYTNKTGQMLVRMSNDEWNLYVNVHTIKMSAGMVQDQYLADVAGIAKMEADAKMAVAELMLKES